MTFWACSEAAIDQSNTLFEKVEGAYCFGLVRPSVTNLRYSFEIS